MEEIILRKLSLLDKEDFTNYLIEQVIESGALKGVNLLDGLSFREHLEFYNKSEKIAFDNYNQIETPFFQYVLYRKSDNKIVGAVNIRPYLNRELDENFEGNIGYSIRPSERGKGYGNKALELAISEFTKLNSKDDIIICCYKENLPSKKIIQKMGGTLIEEKEGVLTPQKYLIKIEK